MEVRMDNDAPIVTETEALDVLTNIILGLAVTDAYHERDAEVLLEMMEQDVKRYLIGQIQWRTDD